MEILTLDQIKLADRFTIENENIHSYTLMERVALNCAERLIQLVPKKSSFFFYCGQGNNGGDGLLIAKYLRKEGYDVQVFVIQHTESPSEDFIRASKEVSHQLIVKAEDWVLPNPATLIIDAILGTGLKRSLSGLLAGIVNRLNELPNAIISIDIPSGLSCDGDFNGFPAIYARHTLTIQWLKLALVLPPQNSHSESFEVIEANILNPNPTNRIEFITAKGIAPLIERRSTFAYKGEFGNLLVLAGSKKYTGAAVLCTHSALRSGVGKVSICSDDTTLSVMRASLPEAITLAEWPDNFELYTSILIGPGIEVTERSGQLLKRILLEFKRPIVLDADAISLLSVHKDWQSLIPKGSVLTPHLGEFKRLFGCDFSNSNGMERAMSFCKQHDCIMVVKGPYTLVCGPDGRSYFNSTGNPGLAKGGSGDVLAGLIAGLIGRGYSSVIASKIGTYIHGFSADLVAKDMDVESMLPSDVIARFSDAFKELKEN